MLDRLMARHLTGLSGASIAAGVLWGWLGTQYLYHAVRFPMMANVISTFWVTACIAMCADAVAAIRGDRSVGWHWPAMALCAGMAVITRPTNAVVAVFGVYAFSVLIREGLLLRLVRWTPLIALALVPLLLQMLVWHVMFGHYISYSYGGNTFGTGGTEKFYWTDPVLWKSLFSLRAGVFLWCPIFALGSIAATVYTFRRASGGWVVTCYVIAFVLLWYLNSAWWCWPFSCYPGRAFMEMIGLPVLGIALLYQHTAASLVQRRALLAVLLLCFACTYLLEASYDLSRVPRYADDMMLMGPGAAARAR